MYLKFSSSCGIFDIILWYAIHVVVARYKTRYILCCTTIILVDFCWWTSYGEYWLKNKFYYTVVLICNFFFHVLHKSWFYIVIDSGKWNLVLNYFCIYLVWIFSFLNNLSIKLCELIFRTYILYYFDFCLSY